MGVLSCHGCSCATPLTIKMYNGVASTVNDLFDHRCGMSREDPHFRLRFPEALRHKVEEAAQANKRSMTAEILARLEASFEIGDGPKVFLDANVIQEMIAAARTTKPLRPNDQNTVYVILDTNGMPISWNEAHTHLGELNRAAGMALHTQQVFVVSPEMLSAGGREAEDLKLVAEYAKLRREQRKAKKPAPPKG
jgi:hypothetical protein